MHGYTVTSVELAHLKSSGQMNTVPNLTNERVIFEDDREGSTFSIKEFHRVRGSLYVRVSHNKKLEGPPYKCPVVGCKKETTSTKGLLNHGTRDHQF